MSFDYKRNHKELGFNKIKSEVIWRLRFPSIFSQHCGILGAYRMLRRASVLGVCALLQLNHHWCRITITPSLFKERETDWK